MRYDRTRPLEQQDKAGQAVAARWRRRVRHKMRSSVTDAAMAIVLLGAIFIMSYTISFGVRNSAAPWIAWIEQAPSPDGQPDGGFVLIEGVVAADARPLLQDFVAYVEEPHYDSSRTSRRHVRKSTNRSAFSVDAPQGRYRLTSDAYQLSFSNDSWFGGWYAGTELLFHDWDHEERVAYNTEGSFPGSIRLRGIARGLPVVVIGKKAAGRALDPWFVIAGTRAEVLGKLRTISGFGLANVLAVIAGVLLALVIAYTALGLFRMARQRPARSNS